MRPKNWNDVLNALAIIQQYAIPTTVHESRSRAPHSPVGPGPDARSDVGAPVSCLVGAERHGTVPLDDLLADGGGDDLG